MTGDDGYGRFQRHEVALRRQREETRDRPFRIPLPHVHCVDIVGLWNDKDGVEQKVGHWARCAFPACGWAAPPRTGDDLDAAWDAAKADRDGHQREVLRDR